MHEHHITITVGPTLTRVCFHGHSARIGRQEDEEEAYKEIMEQKRKAKRSKKASRDPKQRKINF